MREPDKFLAQLLAAHPEHINGPAYITPSGLLIVPGARSPTAALEEYSRLPDVPFHLIASLPPKGGLPRMSLFGTNHPAIHVLRPCAVGDDYELVCSEILGKSMLDANMADFRKGALKIHGPALGPLRP